MAERDRRSCVRAEKLGRRVRGYRIVGVRSAYSRGWFGREVFALGCFRWVKIGIVWVGVGVEVGVGGFGFGFGSEVWNLRKICSGGGGCCLFFVAFSFLGVGGRGGGLELGGRRIFLGRLTSCWFFQPRWETRCTR